MTDQTMEMQQEPSARRPRASRRVKNSPLASYLWEQVPRPLLADAKAKAHAEGTSIKQVLIGLLRDWTYMEEPPRFTRADVRQACAQERINAERIDEVIDALDAIRP